MRITRAMLMNFCAVLTPRFQITRAMLMNFCAVLTPRCQILIWVCKVFRVFQRIFACEKVKGNIMKRQKTSALKHFSLPRYSKKWTA